MPPKTKTPKDLGDSGGEDGGDPTEGEEQSLVGHATIMAAIANIQRQLEQQGAQLAQQGAQLAQQGWAVREDGAAAGAPDPQARETCRLATGPALVRRDDDEDGRFPRGRGRGGGVVRRRVSVVRGVAYSRRVVVERAALNITIQ